MTDNWYLLTLIGEDKPGIVTAVSKALFGLGLNPGETSMLRLGGHFTTIMMVSVCGMPTRRLCNWAR